MTITVKDFNNLFTACIDKVNLNSDMEESIVSSVYLVSNIKIFIPEILLFEKTIGKELIKFKYKDNTKSFINLDLEFTLYTLYAFFTVYDIYTKQNKESAFIEDAEVLSDINKAIKTVYDYITKK